MVKKLDHLHLLLYKVKQKLLLELILSVSQSILKQQTQESFSHFDA